MMPKYILSAATLLQLACSQIVLIDEDATDLETGQFEQVLESANMTAHQTFTGRDVSAEYPGEPQDGWQVHLSIKDDIEVDGDREQVASVITLEGPDGSVEFDDSWNLCAYVYPIKASSGDGYGTDYDGDCSGLIAPECVDDLLKRGRRYYASDCPTIETVPSCLQDLDEDSDGDSIRINGDNADNLIGNGTYFYARADGEPHDTDQDEPSKLLSAAEKANAILTLFGPSGERGDDDEVFAEVRCLMANEVTEGSYDPDAQEEGAASSGMTAFAGWAFVSAAVAFQLL